MIHALIAEYLGHLFQIGLLVLLVCLVLGLVRAGACFKAKLAHQPTPPGLRTASPRPPKTLGENIRRHRLENDLSEDAFANWLGVSPELVRRWEADEVSPDARQLSEMARVLGIPTQLLYEDVPAF